MHCEKQISDFQAIFFFCSRKTMMNDEKILFKPLLGSYEVIKNLKAILNACLNKIEKLIASETQNFQKEWVFQRFLFVRLIERFKEPASGNFIAHI